MTDPHSLRLRPLLAALLIAAVVTAGCTTAGKVPPATEADQPIIRQAPLVSDPDRPACDAPPLPAPSAAYRERIAAFNAELGIPLHRTRLHGLALQPDTDTLQPIAVADDRGVLALAPEAAQAWILMQAAAAHDGIELVPVSAYRSPAQQRAIVAAKRERGDSWSEILRRNVPPGYSEHHTGDAIDIATPQSPGLVSAFASTEAFDWLQAHAGDYCFALSYPRGNAAGLDFEPWHWRFVREPTGD